MTDVAAEAAEAEVPQTAQAGRYDAFLSYAREDRKFVEQLRGDLIAAGLEVWVDVEDILGGARWRERVTRGIEACKAFVFVISPDSVASGPCKEELSLAGSLNKLIVPVVRRTVYDELPPGLSEFEWIFIGEDADRDVETRNRGVGTRKLVEALQTDLAWRDAHTRLAARAREWVDGDRNGSYLLRGADLRAAEAWLAQQEGHREQPTAAQTEYVARSRQAAGRRLRALLGGLGVALAVAIALAIVALVQRDSAVHNQHVAESRALTVESSQQLGSDAELATLLALRAVRTDSTSGAVLALRQAVGADQLTHVLRNGPATVRYDPADASILATGASDGTIDIWNGQTGKLIASYPKVAPESIAPADLAFGLTGEQLIAGDGQGRIHLWNLQNHTAEVLPTAATASGPASAVAFGPDIMAIGTYKGYVTILRPSGASFAPAGVIDVKAAITNLAFDPSGGSLLITTSHGEAQLVSGTGTLLLERAGGSAADVAAFSRDGQRIVMGDVGGGVYLWSGAGKLVATPSLPDDGSGSTQVFSAGFSPDDQLLAVGYGTGQVGVFDASTGGFVNAITASDVAVESVAFLPNDTLVVGYADGVTREFDPTAGTQLAALGDGPGDLVDAAANSTGSQIATEDAEGGLHLWNAFPGRVLWNAPGASVAGLTPNGRSLVWLVGQTLEADTGGRTRSLGTLSDSGALHVTPWFSADSRMAVIPQDEGATLVNLRTGVRATLIDARVYPTKLSFGQVGSFNRNDTRFVAPVTSGGAAIWNTGGHLVRRIDAGKTIDQALYSPSGAQIAVAGENGTAYLIPSAGTGATMMLANPSNAGAVTDVAFSPNGRLVATATNGLDPRVRLWSTITGREVGSGLTEDGYFVAFSPDGEQLATATVGENVLVVPVSSHGFESSAAQTISTGLASSAAFASGGQLIVDQAGSGAGGTGPAVFDLASGQLTQRLGDAAGYGIVSYAAGKVLSITGTGATLYKCDACGSTPLLIKNAESVLVQRLTRAQISHDVDGG
jgi:WD40 repeat protein